MTFKYVKNYINQVTIKRILGKIPGVYIKIQKIRYRQKRFKKNIVTNKTDIVIEGYPRSANSFSVKAFKFANGDDYKIATHLHAFQQVIVGVKKKIPTIVLIREPFECIVSYAAFRAQKYGDGAFIDYNMKWLLQDYVTFYKKLLPYKNKVIIGVFKDVLNDYGIIINKVNQKYNTNFTTFNHTEENVALVFNSAKVHLSPSKERDIEKQKYLQQMTKLKSSRLFLDAEELYIEWNKTANKIK